MIQKILLGKILLRWHHRVSPPSLAFFPSHGHMIIKRYMNIPVQLYHNARKSKKQLDWVSYNANEKLHKKRNPKKQKKFYLKELRDTFNKPDKFWNTVKKTWPHKVKILWGKKLRTTFCTIDNKLLNSKPLAHIINCSLMSGVVPSDLKRARVVPVNKSSAHDNFDNYRPISVLP